MVLKSVDITNAKNAVIAPRLRRLRKKTLRLDREVETDHETGFDELSEDAPDIVESTKKTEGEEEAEKTDVSSSSVAIGGDHNRTRFK